ncbi:MULTISPECIES: arsenate reductase/protein-tyrosine-phosphatase family protein [unclassified Geodermatophilus]
MSGTGQPEEPLRVLVVCTGNICRSPAAELLLRAGLGPAAGVEVTSAGLSAPVGEPVAEPMARLLRAQGVDPGVSTARQVQPGAVRDADLVLTMTAAQRRAVVTSVPSAVRRTFTLVEFADVAALVGVARLPGGPAERIAAALRAAPVARAQRTGTTAEDDIEDPYGRSEDVFSRVLDRIDGAVERLLRELREPALSRAGTAGTDGPQP